MEEVRVGGTSLSPSTCAEERVRMVLRTTSLPGAFPPPGHRDPSLLCSLLAPTLYLGGHYVQFPYQNVTR